MVRTKLDILKEEIEHYISIPYFSNTLKQTFPDNTLVGKGTWQEIFKLVPKDIKEGKKFTYLKKQKIGIDCSGLVYHLLNFYSQLKFNKPVHNYLIGTDHKYGVRRLSANLLTAPINSIQIRNYNDIKTADIIRYNQGKHVLFIIEKKENIIYLVHSSKNTIPSGVHYATIEITDYSKPLNLQKWSDTTKSQTNYANLLNPENLDGIYRPRFLL